VESKLISPSWRLVRGYCLRLLSLWLICSCLIIISPQSHVRRFSVWPLPNTACASVTEIWFLQYTVVSLQFHLSYMWDDFQFNLYQTLHVPQSLRYDSCNIQLSHYNFTSVTCETIFSLTSTKHCMCLSHWDMIPVICSCLIIISRQSHVRRFSV
jgi:hypothetical protein